MAVFLRQVSLAHLAAGEDGETAGALVVEETPDEIFVVRLFHGLHYILQRVGDVWLLKQREHELTAPPAGQVVQRQQTPAHPLQGGQQQGHHLKKKKHKTGFLLMILAHFIVTSAGVHAKSLQVIFQCRLTCLSGCLGSIGGSVCAVQIR